METPMRDTHLQRLLCILDSVVHVKEQRRKRPTSVCVHYVCECVRVCVCVCVSDHEEGEGGRIYELACAQHADRERNEKTETHARTHACQVGQGARRETEVEQEKAPALVVGARFVREERGQRAQT